MLCEGVGVGNFGMVGHFTSYSATRVAAEVFPCHLRQHHHVDRSHPTHASASFAVCGLNSITWIMDSFVCPPQGIHIEFGPVSNTGSALTTSSLFLLMVYVHRFALYLLTCNPIQSCCTLNDTSARGAADIACVSVISCRVCRRDQHKSQRHDVASSERGCVTYGDDAVLRRHPHQRGVQGVLRKPAACTQLSPTEPLSYLIVHFAQS